MNIIGQTLRKVGLKDKLNILTHATHETFETNLCLTGHNFYSLELPNFKTWNTQAREIPFNYTVFHDGKIPEYLDIDILLSQNLFDQYQYLKPLSDKFNIPLVNIQHCYPYLNHWPKRQLEALRSMRGDINVFITDNSRKAWGFNEQNSIVIEHAIDNTIFCPDPSIDKQNYILSVCNQFNKPERFAPCGFPLWQQIMRELPFKHIGDKCEGLGLPAKNIDDLINEYRKAAIFINTSQISPIPMSVLEAASVGLPIVSTATCAIPEIFAHGKNALLSNNPQELRAFCVELLQNESLRNQLGKTARELISKRFPVARFIDSYNSVFQKALTLK